MENKVKEQSTLGIYLENGIPYIGTPHKSGKRLLSNKKEITESEILQLITYLIREKYNNVGFTFETDDSVVKVIVVDTKNNTVTSTETSNDV